MPIVIGGRDNCSEKKLNNLSTVKKEKRKEN